MVNLLDEALEALEPEERALLLLDASESTSDRSTSEVRQEANALGTRSLRIERVAVLTNSDLQFGLARMGAAFAYSAGVRVGVFRTESEALAYLNGKTELDF